MKIRIRNLNLAPGYNSGQLLKVVARTLRCRPTDLQSPHTVRRSVDARGPTPRMIVTAEVDYAGHGLPDAPNIEAVVTQAVAARPSIRDYSGPRPLVVGAGPAGLMAAFALAEAGLQPVLIERGEAAAARAERVGAFWHGGVLHPESNVLFGEGGAGLFSDGKLTSRSKDRALTRRFFEILVECGADPDILIDAEPHLGSDMLAVLAPTLRRRIQAMGGSVRFGARLDDLDIEDGIVRGALVAAEPIRTDHCVLATGHSARDTFRMLARRGVPMEPKPFAVGVRLEMPQNRIDAAQWGGPVPALGKASFRMTRRAENGIGACYTFCMCPGGLVIACASSSGCLTTNGMSLSQRDRPFGNAAFLVPVGSADFGAASTAAMAGMEFQQRMEEAAFAAGGGDYHLPTQRLVDYLEGRVSRDLPAERSCERARPADLRATLPAFVDRTLRATIPSMLRGLRGLRREEVLVYAAETRSSSPLRILRDDDGQSIGLRGLYPCGEGAGYAGGIVSSGMDGLRLADLIVGRMMH